MVSTAYSLEFGSQLVQMGSLSPSLALLIMCLGSSVVGEGAREGKTGTGALVLGKLKNSLPEMASLRAHTPSASFSQL